MPLYFVCDDNRLLPSEPVDAWKDAAPPSCCARALDAADTEAPFMAFPAVHAPPLLPPPLPLNPNARPTPENVRERMVIAGIPVRADVTQSATPPNASRPSGMPRPRPAPSAALLLPDAVLLFGGGGGARETVRDAEGDCEGDAARVEEKLVDAEREAVVEAEPRPSAHRHLLKRYSMSAPPSVSIHSCCLFSMDV